MKPVTFDSETIRSILKDEIHLFTIAVDKDIVYQWDCESDGTPIAFIEQSTGDSYPPTYPCKYKVGDILYVRESWRPIKAWSGSDTGCTIEYKAGGTKTFNDNIITIPQKDTMWRYPFSMPKEAARIFLQVVKVTLKLFQNKWTYLIQFEVVDKKDV